MGERILILGGTKEAAALASELVKKGNDVITSLAGRTKEPTSLAGQTRIGGFGGVSGMVKFLKQNKIDRLIDATHPFAKQISKNAIEAAKVSDTHFEIRTRLPWQKQLGDNWIEVKSLEVARDTIATNARVLLALGHQHIELFKERDDVFFLVRMVDTPTKKLTLPQHQLLIGRPCADWQSEAEILTQNNITHIICRNSGGSGAYAKIEAARELKMPVIILQREA